MMGDNDMNTSEIQEGQLPVLELPEGVSAQDIATVILHIIKLLWQYHEDYKIINQTFFFQRQRCPVICLHKNATVF